MKSAKVHVNNTKQKQLGRVHMYVIHGVNVDTGAVMKFVDANKDNFTIWGNEETYSEVDRIDYEPVEGSGAVVNQVQDIIF